VIHSWNLFGLKDGYCGATVVTLLDVFRLENGGFGNPSRNAGTEQDLKSLLALKSERELLRVYLTTTLEKE
jgi:hypothetical protein